MNRPASNIRPIGPIVGQDGLFGKSDGVAKIRVKYIYASKQGSLEVRQSLEENVRSRVQEIVPVSNVSVLTEGEDYYIQVGMDIDKKTFSDAEEDKVGRAIGRALVDSGVESLRQDGYEYSAVIR